MPSVDEYVAELREPDEQGWQGDPYARACGIIRGLTYQVLNGDLPDHEFRDEVTAVLDAKDRVVEGQLRDMGVCSDCRANDHDTCRTEREDATCKCWACAADRAEGSS